MSAFGALTQLAHLSENTYNSSMCYNVSRGRVTTVQCDYPFSYHLEDALYRSMFGIVFDLIECIFLGALWFCNIWIQRDFTESFMTCVALPLSASTALKFATYAWDIFFPRQFESGWLINVTFSTMVTSSQLTLVMGLPFYLFMAIKTGATRKQGYSCCTWLPYLMVLIVSFPVAGVFSMVHDRFYSVSALCVMLGIFVISFCAIYAFTGMSCMAFVCCTNTRRQMDMLDPVVYDARSRLGWAILFSVVSPMPSLGAIYCYIRLAFFIDTTDDFALLSNEMTTRCWNFFFAPILLIYACFILPAYRDTLMCGCRYRQLGKSVSIKELVANGIASANYPQMQVATVEQFEAPPTHVVDRVVEKEMRIIERPPEPRRVSIHQPVYHHQQQQFQAPPPQHQQQHHEHTVALYYPPPPPFPGTDNYYVNTGAPAPFQMITPVTK